LWEVGLTDGQTIDPLVDLVRSRGLNRVTSSRSGKAWKTCSWPPSRRQNRVSTGRYAATPALVSEPRHEVHRDPQRLLLEAIDTKVFFVMLGLSALVIALVGSVSFRSVSVETT
jgi:hypothetical protein